MIQPFDPAQTFEALRSEVEAPWLDQVYFPPREFSLMRGHHSIVVMGDEGSGKSALDLQLKGHSAQQNPRLLVASWRLQLPPEEPSDSNQVSDIFMSQAMDSLSFAFLQTVSRIPTLYSNTYPWVRQFINWHINQYLQGDRQFIINRLEEGSVPGGLDIVRRIFAQSQYRLFTDTSPTSILPNLTGAVGALGFSGIWIFMDGLDILFRRSPDKLERFLNNFLSTLDYFEDPAFVFKIVVSNELGQKLQKTRGVITRRFKTFHLKWGQEELTQLIEKRIAFALKRKQATLEELCKDSEWRRWLTRYAGDSPRGWLELTRPILLAYMNKGKTLTTTEWMDVYRQSPPPLRLDLDTGHTFIGYGEVDVLGISYKLLKYLYENRHRSCTKSELYYYVLRELPKEPHSDKDEGWEDITSWDGTMDTALWRLRQAVEWDTRKRAVPLYVVSERGRGHIHLENAV